MQIRNNLHKAIDRLNEEQLAQLMSVTESLLTTAPDPIIVRLSKMPGVRLPMHWPPKFKRIIPLKAEGEIPSKRLIRERR